MNDLVEWMREFARIGDKGSLYARVLLVMIREREQLVRQELVRIADTSIRDSDHRAKVRRYAHHGSLESLLALYVNRRKPESRLTTVSAAP